MKNTSLILASLLILAGCSKELPVTDVQGKEEIQFSAVADFTTKSTLNPDGKVFWTTNDAISVFSSADLSVNEKFQSSDIAQSNATFKGKATPSEKYYAIYPYHTENRMMGNKVSFVISSNQQLQNGSFANTINPSVAVSQGNVLNFKNVAALISFKVPALNGKNIVKAVFKGNAAEKIAGDMTVDMSLDTKVAAPASSALSEVVLSGTFVENEVYYIVTAPAEYTNGIQLSLVDNEDHAYTIKGTRPVTTTAGAILPLAGFELEPPTPSSDLYVKVGATGTGAGWNDATTLTNALAKAKDGNTIHVAAGTYHPENFITGGDETNAKNKTFELKVNAAIVGGYPAEAKDGDMPDPDANKVILSGNKSCYRVLVVSAPKKEGYRASVSGVTITEGNCNGSTDINLNGGLLKKQLGAGLLVVGSNFSLSNSRVEKNEGPFCPGMLNCDAANTVIDNCVFDSNVATTNAGNIWNSAATLEIKGSVISNNKAVGGVGAGLLTMSYTALKDVPTLTYVYNTLFDSNSCKNRGAGLFVRQGSKTAVVNCTFTGNKGVNGGISVHGTGAELCLVSSTLTNNTGAKEGVLNTLSGAKAKVYNTLISGNSLGENNAVSLAAQKTSEAFSYVIAEAKQYDKTGTESASSFESTMFLPFANNVYALTPDATARTCGMPIAELNTVLSGFSQEFDKTYLSIDQNGKPRSGSIMGSSVE